MILSMVSDTILSSVNTAAVSDSFISDLKEVGSSSATSKTSGPIEDIGNAIANILNSLNLTYVIIAVALLVGLFILLKFSPAGWLSSLAGGGKNKKSDETEKKNKDDK
jgi:hypothetical protein